MLRPKWFPLRFAKWEEDVILLVLHNRRLGPVVLDFCIPPKPQKTVRIDSIEYWKKFVLIVIRRLNVLSIKAPGTLSQMNPSNNPS